MYGGVIVYVRKPICGYFARKNYITLELQDGNKLEDKWGILEGTGKERRHIKININEDRTEKMKQVEYYLRELFPKNG